jgi:hypothetical protein
VHNRAVIPPYFEREASAARGGRVPKAIQDYR